jgi:hypothetical protein
MYNGCITLDGLVAGLIFKGVQISDPAPLILDCKPERHRRVHCIWLYC